MGHLLPHQELLRRLREQGHELHVISRDIPKAYAALGDVAHAVWPAPLSTEQPTLVHKPTASVSQCLHNAGYSSESTAFALIDSWRRTLDLISPDLILTDFAPGLLLAARGRNILTANLSSGFLVPPTGEHTEQYWILKDRLPKTIEQDDSVMLPRLSGALRRASLPELRNVPELFHQGIVSLLKTVPELDHFPERKDAIYVGTPPSPPSKKVNFAPTKGPRVAAYLKPFPGMDRLLTALKRMNASVLISGSLPADLQKDFASEQIQFLDHPLDLWDLKGKCELFVNHGSLSSCAHMLQNEIPVLTIPLFLEQELTAARMDQLGVGGYVLPRTQGDFEPTLTKLLQSSYAQKAKEFASRASAYPLSTQVDRVLSHLARLSPLISGS